MTGEADAVVVEASPDDNDVLCGICSGGVYIPWVRCCAPLMQQRASYP